MLNYILVDKDSLANMANTRIKLESICKSDHDLLMIPFDARPLRKTRPRREKIWRLYLKPPTRYQRAGELLSLTERKAGNLFDGYGDY